MMGIFPSLFPWCLWRMAVAMKYWYVAPQEIEERRYNRLQLAFINCSSSIPLAPDELLWNGVSLNV